MGEEAKQEEAKAEEKTEEKTEEKKEEPMPPSPVVLLVDLHCVGCAKKIEKSIMKLRGVEAVVTNMEQNQVTIKGIVEPQALCMRIQKKTKRRAKILSPLPPAEGQPVPETVTSQVSGLTTIELKINMHCEACAQQLRRKILKMKGVQTAETDLSTGKVTVTGTMDAKRLVEYVYRRTKKQAQIVPQPEPEANPEKPEEKKEGDEKAAEEAAKPEEKGEENGGNKEGEMATEEEKKNGEGNKGNEGEGKEEKEGESNEEAKKEGEGEGNNIYCYNEETMKKMMYYHYPLYVIERVPPPQLFSDENPNACCIS